MKNTLPLFTLISLITSSAFAEVTSYKLPVTRQDKTVTRLAFPFWSGEYPLPVIDVSAAKSKGESTIQAYKSLRDLKEKVSCTILNGVYNPWSKDTTSAINYYSLISVQEYKVIKKTKWEDSTLAVGSLVTNVMYHGEGYCGATANKQEIQVYCDLLDDKTVFTKITPDDSFAEQWINVECKEGYNAFVQDTTLLLQDGVQEGQVLGYGEVGPAEPSNHSKPQD